MSLIFPYYIKITPVCISHRKDVNKEASASSDANDATCLCEMTFIVWYSILQPLYICPIFYISHACI